jgi:hypothetical protein
MLTACAPLIPSEPVQMTVARGDLSEFVLVAATAVEVPNEYPRTLAAGSRWRHVGAVPAGEVYRPVGGVFTIEGRQVHEAYLVVSKSALVGFYLSGESRYSDLPTPIPLPIGDVK